MFSLYGLAGFFIFQTITTIHVPAFALLLHLACSIRLRQASALFFLHLLVSWPEVVVFVLWKLLAFMLLISCRGLIISHHPHV